MIKFDMKKIFFLCLLSIIFICWTPDGFSSELKFSVETQIPENQIDKEKSYFDLLVQKDTKQTIKLLLNNTTDKDVVVTATVKAATTNSNGVVEYGESKTTLDSSAQLNIEDVIKPEFQEGKLVIPAHQTIEAPFLITMPNETFNGILAGGITIQEEANNKKPDADTKSGMAIDNQYAYTVAVLLRQNEDPVDLAIRLIGAEPGQRNYRNVIFANLVNKSPDYINQVEVEAKIMNKKNPQEILTATNDNMQIAPNSTFAYPIAYDDKKMEAGTYTLDLVVKGSGKEWAFLKDFEITSDEAQKLNAADVTLKSELNIWFHICLVLIGLLLFVTWFVSKKK